MLESTNCSDEDLDDGRIRLVRTSVGITIPQVHGAVKHQPKKQPQLPANPLAQAISHENLMARPQPDSIHFRFPELYDFLDEYLHHYSPDGRNAEVLIVNSAGQTLYTIGLIIGYNIMVSIRKFNNRAQMFLYVFRDRLEIPDKSITPTQGNPRPTLVVDANNFVIPFKHHTREGIDLWLRLMEYLVEQKPKP